MYCYIAEEDNFVVGFFAPDGIWFMESVWTRRSLAAARVHYLNGGAPQEDWHDAKDWKVNLERVAIEQVPNGG